MFEVLTYCTVAVVSVVILFLVGLGCFSGIQMLVQGMRCRDWRSIREGLWCAAGPTLSLIFYVPVVGRLVS
ncbi:MAG: hypothetical protein WCV85_05335 [Patescibacteria group bacterium]